MTGPIDNNENAIKKLFVKHTFGKLFPKDNENIPSTKEGKQTEPVFIFDDINKGGMQTMRYPSDDGGEINIGEKDKIGDGMQTMRYPSDDGGEINIGKKGKDEGIKQTMMAPSDDGGEINFAENILQKLKKLLNSK